MTSRKFFSRRTSTSCLINLEKPIQPPRSRSASFSEDLTARLQILAAGNNYRSYTPATITPAPRLPIRPSLNSNIRFPPSSISPIPAKTTSPSITFQLRYEQTIETLFITIFQLQNSLSGKDELFSKDFHEKDVRYLSSEKYSKFFSYSLSLTKR